jgi:hypothetical protein
MKRRRIACIALAVVAGCATGPDRSTDTVLRSSTVRKIAPGPLANAVTPGRSTRSEVRAALGEATVIRFDSGFEVWVYRFDEPARGERARARGNDEAGPSGEFVVLFDPSGIASKTRVLLYAGGSTNAPSR